MKESFSVFLDFVLVNFNALGKHNLMSIKFTSSRVVGELKRKIPRAKESLKDLKKKLIFCTKKTLCCCLWQPLQKQHWKMQQSHLLCFLPCNIKAFNPMLQAVQITTAFPQLHCDHHDQMHHDRQHHKHPTTRIRNSYFYSVLHAPSLFPWILKKLSTNENSATQPAGIACSSSWI